MLRRSTVPTLRSLAAAPAVQRIQARSMVSTVLLTRESYNDSKVADLKTELKQRGLSTTGKRSVLIQRLTENDSRRASGKSNVVPVSTPATVAAAASARPLSSTSQQRATPAASAPPTPSEGAVGLQSTGASVSHPPDMEPGQVSSVKDSLPEQLRDLAAPELNPPGLPPQKNPAPPITFDVKIPYYPEPPLQGPKIPLFTAYLDPSHRSTIDPDVQAPRPFLPRVLAVSSPEAVSHHHGDTADATASEDSPSSSTKAAPGVVGQLLNQFKADLGISDADIERATKAAKAASEAVEDKTSGARKVLQEAAADAKGAAKDAASAVSGGSGGAQGSSGSGASATGADEGLSPRSYSGSHSSGAQEGNAAGLAALGAIVALGFAAGALGKPSEKHKSKLRVELEKIRKMGEAERMQYGQVKRPAQWSDKEVERLVSKAEEALQ